MHKGQSRVSDARSQCFDGKELGLVSSQIDPHPRGTLQLCRNDGLLSVTS